MRGCQELAGLVFPAAILVVKSVRVGLVGLVTRAENRLSGGDCRIFEPVQVLKNLIPVLKPHCDLLIVLSHLGYSLDAGSAQMIDAGDVELAKSLPHGGVDLIIGGHSHSVLNMGGLAPENIVNGIPIVQAGALGRFLGKVDITLRDGRVSVTNARLIPIDNLPVDAAFERDQVQPLIAQARDLFARSLGRVEDDRNLGTDVVQNRYAAGELALANFISDAIVDRLHQSGHPVAFAMIDSSSLYSGLPVGGSLTFGDWFNIMPFADTIRLYQMTGQQLFDLLQDNARRIDRPGEPHTERGFLHFSAGVRYKIHPGEDRSHSWVDEIMVNDVPLEGQLGKDFIVAGTSFIRELASQWELRQSVHPEHTLFDLNGLPYSETDVFLRNELVNYIIQHGGVTKSGGARCDGRLQVAQDLYSPVTHLRVDEFIKTISRQDHAMAGAVIAISAAHATALGQACLQITRNLSESAGQEIDAAISALTMVKNQLLQWCNRDASAIAEFVALREAGHELEGQRLLCQAPAEVGQLSIKAAGILQVARSFINDRVKDDLEISISLLTGAAQAARLLLDSNLRIWSDSALLASFEPVLAELETGIHTLQPVEIFRS
jgi:formiminotetrahydrofolate cyclodeaminase